MDNAHVVEQQILSTRQRYIRAHACKYTLGEVILHHNTQKTPEAAEVGKGARISIVKEWRRRKLEGNQWQIGEDIARCNKQKFKVTYAYLEGSSVLAPMKPNNIKYYIFAKYLNGDDVMSLWKKDQLDQNTVTNTPLRRTAIFMTKLETYMTQSLFVVV